MTRRASRSVAAAHDVTSPTASGASSRRRPGDAAGERVALVGPNGAGKSTPAARDDRRAARRAPGRSACAATPIDDRRPRRPSPARSPSSPSSPQLPFEMPVDEVVALGRLPHEPPFTGLRPADRAAVAARDGAGGHRPPRAIATCASCRWASASSCSSPSPSRRSAPILRPRRADGAPRHPPPGRRHGAARRPQRRDGTTVVAVLHDLALAAHFFPRVVVMSDGRIVADGSPAATLGRRPDPVGLRRGPGARAPAGRGGLRRGRVRGRGAGDPGAVATVRAARRAADPAAGRGRRRRTRGAAAFAARRGGRRARRRPCRSCSSASPASRCSARSPRSGRSPSCPAACTWTAWPTRPTRCSRPTPAAAERAREDPAIGPGGARRAACSSWRPRSPRSRA